jgi:hypothetical protein
MRVPLQLDPETYDALERAATEERRPMKLEAEVILMRVLGTYRGTETGYGSPDVVRPSPETASPLGEE